MTFCWMLGLGRFGVKMSSQEREVSNRQAGQRVEGGNGKEFPTQIVYVSVSVSVYLSSHILLCLCSWSLNKNANSHPR